MRVAKGKLTIENSIFESNEAKEGGAIFLLEGADVTISNSVFLTNKAVVRSFLTPS